MYARNRAKPWNPIAFVCNIEDEKKFYLRILVTFIFYFFLIIFLLIRICILEKIKEFTTRFSREFKEHILARQNGRALAKKL